MNARDRRIERLAERIERDTLEMDMLLLSRNFEDRIESLTLTMDDLEAWIDSRKASAKEADA